MDWQPTLGAMLGDENRCDFRVWAPKANAVDVHLLGDDRYVMRGTRLLTRAWKPKVQRIWPGPVAGFLLGHVDARSLIEGGYSDPDLEARRLASAHFWAALKDPTNAKTHYQAAVAGEGAGILEVEHHLAHGELW